MSKLIVFIILFYTQASYAGNVGSTVSNTGMSFIDEAVTSTNRRACFTSGLVRESSNFTEEVIKETASFVHPSLKGVDLKVLKQKYENFLLLRGKRLEKMNQIDLLLASINQEEGPVCVDETSNREGARNRCLTLCGISTTLAYVGGAITGKWWGGLVGLIPGPFAYNACRIWEEREVQLERCEKHHLDLKRQKLKDNQQRIDHIEELNREYDRREEDLIEESREAIRQLTIEYSRRGANFRDSEVQSEIRREAKTIQDKLEQDLSRLNQERADAIAAI